MQQRHITIALLRKFQRFLVHEERETGTIEKYLRNVRQFSSWLGCNQVTKESSAKWKEYLLLTGYHPVTVNSMLSALNRFFLCVGWHDCKVKYLRIQHQIFRSVEKELTKEEYGSLLRTALNLGRERIALLMETICATGIRVSEVQYITVEAARQGRAEVSLKGKIRTILIPRKLCQKLIKYSRKQKIASGEIFLTKSGKRLSRRQIWAEMKALCKKSGIPSSKVFPHNLRHLFARTFYQVCRDIVKLADVLGHSSIETTRIYLISTSAEHARQLERLGLMC